MTSKKHTYRIKFHNQGKVFEIYARGVHQSALLGFVEIENIVFGEKSSVVVDPGEESLKAEFGDVSRVYLPMHAVIRIDQVEKAGHSKVVDGGEAKVTPFPIFTGNKDTGKS